MFFLLLFVSGFVVGLLSAFLGIGGGSIIVPVLTLLFHIPIHVAIATSLISVIFASSNASATYIRKGLTNLRLGLFLEIITTIFAIIGGIISVSVSEKYLFISFGSVLLITAYFYIRNIKRGDQEKLLNLRPDSKSFFSGKYYDERLNKEIHYVPINLFLTSTVSGIAGLLSGMLGIGGGVFKVPAMNLISKIPIKAATTTSNFMMTLTAAAASIVYLKTNLINPVIASFVVMGVFLGSNIGIRFFPKLKDSRIKILFTAFLIVIAFQMFYRGIR
ncbi:sulfite exporter TauE/SafE family protein [Deferribacter autotrophicus]|uniref:Probable membrane transporter protein n=1 Tax=Deferribacter autotrophicus TaxID=500465 RepID=A0A5A8F8B7_9BACT|nr:sulfite exporter TauE/SafE family protein [Deferribacter autotrophicus]KAA0259538.1 sulfite exporter TauE/SafE family protein [Deferribacter autotrophicus]